MDRLLDRGLVTPKMVRAVAQRLADFYRTAERSERIKGFALPERVSEDTDENFEQTRVYVGRTISREQFDEIQGATNGFLSRERERFLRRCQEGRIRDCHGDLRLEHVFFGDEISILCPAGEVYLPLAWQIFTNVYNEDSIELRAYLYLWVAAGNFVSDQINFADKFRTRGIVFLPIEDTFF